MSKGMWKKDGVMMKMTDMDDRYLRNSMKLMYRKLRDLENPATRGSIRGSPEFYTEKLIELGEVAQGRNWEGLQGDITVDQLITVVARWQAEDDESYRRWAARRNPTPAQPPPTLPASEYERVERNLSFDL